MKRNIIIIGIIIIAVAVIFLLQPTAPSENLPQATVEETSLTPPINVDTTSGNIDTALLDVIRTKIKTAEVTITGFGPGKTHPGTFTNYDVVGLTTNTAGNIATGTIVIDVTSRDFGIDKLNEHLCAETFFDCDIYPVITFAYTSFSMTSLAPGDTSNIVQLTVTGDLTFKGITKTISLPITKTGDQYEGNFRLNVSQFNFTYMGMDEEVQIQFKTK